MDCSQNHKYCAVPEPAAVDLAWSEKEMQTEIARLGRELVVITTSDSLGLQWFVGSDEDIEFYIRKVDDSKPT